MKCKKIFALLLSLCMIASSFVAMPVSAASKMTVSVGTVEAKPGDTIDVPVSLSDNTAGLCGLTLTFTYDPDVLTFTKGVQGEALPDMALTKPGAGLAQGSRTFLWDSMESDYSNGEILTLTFVVAEDAGYGDYTVDVSVDSACDFDFYDIDTDAVAGKVSIPAPEPAGLTTITVGSVEEATPGSTIQVPVSISNNTVGLCGLTLTFTYDPDVLTFVRGTQGEALPDMALTKPGSGVAQGSRTFLWDSMESDYSNGEILIMEFDVAANAPAGDHTIDVSVDSACDFDFVDIETEAVAGTVTVPAPKIMTITVGDMEAEQGDTIQVPVTLSNNTEGLCGLTLTFTYDPDVLTFVRGTQGEALPDMALTKPGSGVAQGSRTFLWDSMESDYSNGEILILEFNIADEVYTDDYTIEVTVDSACDFEFNDIENVAENGTISIKGISHVHDYVAVITKEATCTEEGIKTFTCACNDSYTETIPVDSNNHSYGDWEKDDENFHKQVCSACGDTVTGKHDWDNGVETKAPTCEDTGIKTFTCTTCDETRTEVLEALGHSYGKWEYADVDNHKKVCACGYVVTEGHAWDTGVITKQPSHTKEGVMTYTCTTCSGTKTAAIPADADNHSYDEVITKAPTCTEEGIKTFTCECNDSYTEVIEALGHTWDEGVVTKPASHFATGIKTFTCICNETYTEVIPVIPHEYGAWQSVDKTNHKKVCDCGNEVIEAHDWDAGVVTKEPTVAEDGIKTFTCPTCSATYTESIEKLPDPDKTTTVKVGASEAQPGEEVVVPVSLSKNIGLTGLTVNIKYDSDVLTLTGFTTGDALADLTFTKPGDIKANPIRFLWDGIDADDTNGDVLLLTFKVADNAADDTYEIKAIDVTACDVNVEDIAIATLAGSVKVHTHSMTAVAEVPATCTTAGVKAHYLCSACNRAYEDEAGKVLLATTEIPATGHTYGEWEKENDDSHIKSCACGHVVREGHAWDAGVITTKATCTEDGVMTYTCSTCDGTKTEVIERLGHAMSFRPEVPATCTEAGIKEHHVCSICGAAYVLGQTYPVQPEELVIPALGHNLSGWATDGDASHRRDCSYCSYYEVAPHVWDAGVVTTDATCTTAGVKTYTCTTCSGTKTEVIPAKGHTMTFVAEVPAECEADGTKAHYLCANCGKTFEDKAGKTELTDLVINAFGHKLNTGVVTKAATCTEKGVKTYTCQVCGTHTVEEVIAAKGHTMTFKAEVAATCTATGTKAYYKCSACGKTYEDQDGAKELTDLVIAAKGHAWDAGVETKAPTCTAEGIKTITCANCGGSYTTIIPANGHATTLVDEVAATCIAAGTKAHYLCSTCNKTFEDKEGTVELTDLVIAAKGHSWNAGVVTTVPTCTEDGVKTFTCTACGNQKTEAIEATGHSMTFNAEVAATCTVDGTKAHYLCANCGKAFEDMAGADEITNLVITAPGHDWDAGVVTTAETCTEDGVKTFTCTVCGETKTEVIAAKGHAMTFNAEVAATCTVDGTKAHNLCANCGKAFEDVAGTTEITDLVIPALGHAYGEWDKDDADNHKKVCATCGDVVTEAHVWNEGVVTLAATCTVDGVKTYTCTVCGETKTEAITAPGHELGGWVAVDADNHKKECANCDYTETAAHAWDAGVVTQQPTYGKDGVKTYTCTDCGDQSKTETITKKPAAVTDTTITVGDITTRNGHSIKVPVTISNNTGLTDLEFVFEYDTAVLTYVGAEQGTALKNLTLTRPADKTASALTFVWSGAENDSTNGDILYLNFTVNDAAALGDYATTAYVSNSVRHDGDEAPVYINNGTISIIEYTLGDVDDDGIRNVRDVVLMRRYIVGGYNVTILEDAADITRNGAIATNDLVHLRRFLLGGYPDSDILFK